jgi:alcohol dehydrogenase class IV
VKVTSAQLPKLLDVAVNDICHKTNPRACTRADFERIFQAAL